MTMLTLTPKRWYSWAFSVIDNARTLADLHLSNWREKGVLSIEGVDYSVFRESPLGDFICSTQGQCSPEPRNRARSSARSSSVTRRSPTPSERSPPSVGRSCFSTVQRTIGSLAPESCWTRRASATLPDDWPLPVKSFADVARYRPLEARRQLISGVHRPGFE